MYDILILAAKKDFNNLQFLYNSLVHIQPTYNKVYCICPEYPSTLIEGIEYRLDKDVLNIDISKIRVRRTWIYQQYLKLFQIITLNKYLVIDADIIINKDIDIFNGDISNFLISNKIRNKPFFKYIELLFGFPKFYNNSFISEIMLFDRNFISEMVLSKFTNISDFITSSNNTLVIDCFISEYELYGNYIFNYHSDSYEYKDVSIAPRLMFDRFEGTLDEYIASQKDSKFDILNISKL